MWFLDIAEYKKTFDAQKLEIKVNADTICLILTFNELQLQDANPTTACNYKKRWSAVERCISGQYL